jgi:pilus assembly protein CpaE
MGGMAAAVEAYRSAPTRTSSFWRPKAATTFCSASTSSPPSATPGTRVIVIGRINDVMLYRELVRRGVSDYVIAPVNAIDVVRSICSLFSSPEAKAVGRIIAIVGAKGGVGASTVAHNVAWAIARDLALDSVVADLDLAFRHRRPRLQSGPAAGHRGRGVLARPDRYRVPRPPAVEMHRPSQPVGRAGNARPGLRFRR